MLIEKKEIDAEAASSCLKEMCEASGSDKILSLGKFIARNLDALNFLSQSGKSVKQIYDCLKAKGQDVGTYHSFRSACYRAGLRRRTAKSPKAAKEAAKNVTAQSPKRLEIPNEPQNEGNVGGLKNCKAKTSKYNPALPPVFLPGGVEAAIDPETGAKRFEIQAGKE